MTSYMPPQPGHQNAHAPSPQQPGELANQRLPLGPQFVEELPPKRNTLMNVVTILIMVFAFLGTVIILFIALLQSNVPLLLVSIVLAVSTLAFVWLVVWFIDRWEPEPKLLLFGALLWGAGIATGVALLFGLARELTWLMFGLPPLPDWWGPVVEAPILEEILKGLGVLIIFFVARKHFNGPTDGIVFGALSGAGFAFTENILYFSSQAAAGFESSAFEGVVSIGFQFGVRGIAMPLLHPICASLTGAAIGYAARKWGGRGAIGGFFVGLVPAMLVHFIWNGGSTLASVLATDPAQAYGNLALLFFFVMVPIFIAWIIMVIIFRRGDRKLLRERLGEYAHVGWYSRAEVDMLSSMQGRSGARAWAKRAGPETERAMRTFIEESTRLAHVRTRVLHSPGNQASLRAEQELLSDLTRIRRVLNRSQPAGAQHMQAAPAVAVSMNAPPRMPQPYQAHPGIQAQPGSHAGPGQPWQGQQPQPGQPLGQQQTGQPWPAQPQPAQPQPAQQAGPQQTGVGGPNSAAHHSPFPPQGSRPPGAPAGNGPYGPPPQGSRPPGAQAGNGPYGPPPQARP